MLVQDRPEPTPGPGEVRIAVKAAGINFADLLARIGLYAEAPKPPAVVGYEVAGEVEYLGAEIFGTTSASKHDAIRGFGVDHPIDYRSQDFAKEVRRIAGEKTPLDLIVDGVGGSSFKKGYSLLSAGGRMICIGASAVMEGERRNLPKALRTVASMPRFNVLRMMQSSRGVIGLNMLKVRDAHRA